MRKITREAREAFNQKREFSKSNTRVEIDNNEESYLYLFNNLIAKTEDGEIWISDGGYHPTNTTRERLSPFINISINRGNFILNNRFKWDGKWLNVNKFNDRN
jgi:hypothetical protein